MKSLLLLLLRLSTGLLLVAWGLVKIAAPTAATKVSDHYYSGMLSADALQLPLGVAEVFVGLLVCLGLLRKFVYPIQAAVLVFGALAIWRYILDPLGLYLLTEETRQLLFFPSFCVAVASLILLAFKEDDALSLDRKLGLKF